MQQIPIFNVSLQHNLFDEASQGAYNKWKYLITDKNGKQRHIWIKAGSKPFGLYNHESIMEVIASYLAYDLGLVGTGVDILQYKPCLLKIKELDGTIVNSIGCYSYDFTEQNGKDIGDEVINLYDLLHYSSNTLGYKQAIELVSKKTNGQITPQQYRQYLDTTILLDSLVLNADRHPGNLAIIQNRNTGRYRLSPIFDFGLGIKGLSNIHERTPDFEDYLMDDEYRPAKPFSDYFDAQLVLTRFKRNSVENAKLRQLGNSFIQKTKTNKCHTSNMLNMLFLYFSSKDEYLPKWNTEQRKKIDFIRQQMWGKENWEKGSLVDNPFTLKERDYILQVIKRRIEVVIFGQPLIEFGHQATQRLNKEIERLLEENRKVG